MLYLQLFCATSEEVCTKQKTNDDYGVLDTAYNLADGGHSFTRSFEG